MKCVRYSGKDEKSKALGPCKARVKVLPQRAVGGVCGRHMGIDTELFRKQRNRGRATAVSDAQSPTLPEYDRDSGLITASILGRLDAHHLKSHQPVSEGDQHTSVFEQKNRRSNLAISGQRAVDRRQKEVIMRSGSTSKDPFTDLRDWVGICGSSIQTAEMSTQGAVPAVSIFGLVTEIALLAVPGAAGKKISPGLDVGINLTVFMLRQAVHSDEFKASEASWDKKDDVATGLSVASSVCDTVGRQCASMGEATPVPHVKAAAVAGLAYSTLLKSTVDGVRNVMLKPLKDKEAAATRK
ncbi:hypothetical protein C8R45DRAFT_1173655 [Mycena sanguinolenta]|nr:hypothetical protein C8R45DRAFT_1173655 [Mycena sanguinolenta]